MAFHFKQDKYAHVKAKRNEPLSNISSSLKKPRLTFEEEVTIPALSNPALAKVILASPAISLKVLSLDPKKTKSRDKGKDKNGESVWEYTTTTLGRARSIVIANKLKSLAFVPSHELVLGETLHITNRYLANEEKAESVDAKAVQAFQTLEEYPDILFLYYLKSFELLRCYLMKHNPGVNLDGLDFEAIDKEIIVDKAIVAEAVVVTSLGLQLITSPKLTTFLEITELKLWLETMPPLLDAMCIFLFGALSVFRLYFEQGPICFRASFQKIFSLMLHPLLTCIIFALCFVYA
nr:hypothetical protein CFP56_15081 [Quercus suber]